MSDRFFGKDYITALRRHYPELVEGDAQKTIDARLHIGMVDKWIRVFDDVGADSPARFQAIEQRAWTGKFDPWEIAGGSGDVRVAAAYGSYKGLINLKPSIDLQLYSALIWELQPKTILEFGSLQGGSGLWFADQLEAQLGAGEVHSFELCIEAVHERARQHPRLTFHKADLRDLKSLDKALLRKLPHPWLVVDDAHENLGQLVPFISSFMTKGDYYVIEDAFLRPTKEIIDMAVQACRSLGFSVDAKYCDAFGPNVTCSPNGWWIKR